MHHRQHPPRPPSPTELSYTQLVKLAPPSSRRRRGPSADIVAVHGGVTVGVGVGVGVGENNDNGAGSGTHDDHDGGAETRMPRRRQPPSDAKTTHAPPLPPQQQQQPPSSGRGGLPSHSHPSTPAATAAAALTIATEDDDRVSRLASRLLPCVVAGGPTLDRPLVTSGSEGGRLVEVRQFIDTLRNMQDAVHRTPDEGGQRARKSRAFNALLGMFERIVEGGGGGAICDPSGIVGGPPLVSNNATRGGRDLEDELRRNRIEISRLVDENERLRAESIRAKAVISREASRARAAEDANAASDVARDSLLSDIARLTGENVELRRALDENRVVDDGIISELEACRAEASRLRESRDRHADDIRRRGMEFADLRRDAMDARAECDGMATELESCRGENAEVRNRLDRTTEELRRRTSDLVDAENRMDDVHDQLVSVRNSLASADEDRRRLREELRISQRNSTAASEQLMGMREQFSRLRTKGGDDRAARRRGGLGHNRDCDNIGGLASSAREEGPTRPPAYEDWTAMSRSDRVGGVGGEYSSAREGSRTSAPRADDDLSARVDELSAWLDRPRSGRESAADLTSFKRGVVSGVTNRDAFDDATEVRFDGDGISHVSYSSGSHHKESSRSASLGPLSMTKIFDGSNSTNGPSLAVPIVSCTNTALDGMGTITNDTAGTRMPNQQKMTHLDTKEENEHPNLMDYFYSQIKLTE